jgi:hypothetical protein
MSGATRDVYVLDTNILIEFAIWIPITLNSVFWTKLTDSLKNGEWVLIDEVVNEIKYMPELKKWCGAQQKAGLVKNISTANRNRAVQINTSHTMINASTGNSTVDTYLLAYAEENGLTIFTKEKPRKVATDPTPPDGSHDGANAQKFNYTS